MVDISYIRDSDDITDLYIDQIDQVGNDDTEDSSPGNSATPPSQGDAGNMNIGRWSLCLYSQYQSSRCY